MRRLKRPIFVAFVASLLVHQVTAQGAGSRVPHWEDSSARKIVAAYRGDPSSMTPILRQVGKNQPQAKLDEIVDSLVRRARNEIAGTRKALFALSQAGRKSRGAADGAPLPGVLDKLILIDRGLPRDAPARATAMSYMLEMPEHTKALNYLLSVVGSERGSMGASALLAIGDELNPGTDAHRGNTLGEIDESRAALRALWDRYSAEPLPRAPNGVVIAIGGPPSRVIPNSDAAIMLSDYARKNGWGGGRKP